MWDHWLLLGDSGTIHWVPSHVEVVSNEHADQQGAKGVRISLQQVTVHKAVTDIWAERSLMMRWLMMRPTLTPPMKRPRLSLVANWHPGGQS